MNKEHEPELVPVVLYNPGLGTNPPGYNGAVAVPWGSRGVIDMSRPWSDLMGNYWNGYWIVDGKAVFYHVLTLLVKPIARAAISDDEMSLLRKCYEDGQRCA